MTCALKCEGQIIKDELKMTRHEGSTLFDTYLDPAGKISLTISGIGKINAAGAVIHTYMLFNEIKNNGWLNFGIAGHALHKPGTPLLANKIIDGTSAQTWYPQLLFNTVLANEALITLDRPSSKYQNNAMFDMEAAGFYGSVTKVSSLELCHSLKIISDNNIQDIARINKITVNRLMEKNLETILSTRDKILNLTTIPDQGHYDEGLYLNLITRHHFTHSQKLQLLKLLKRWQVLQDDVACNITSHNKFSSSSQILDYLNNSLNELPYRL